MAVAAVPKQHDYYRYCFPAGPPKTPCFWRILNHSNHGIPSIACIDNGRNDARVMLIHLVWFIYLFRKFQKSHEVG